MANVKISGLPAASTPLTGAELVPVVQSGVTSQTTVGDFGAAVSYTPSGTGAVTTTVQTKLRETVSVKDFGAVGDGVTDDTAAIQAALASGAGEIYFPKGVYLVNSALNSSSSLYGDGQGYTEIKATAQNDYLVKISGRVVIRDIYFNGNSYVKNCIQNYASNGCLITNCRIEYAQQDGVKFLTSGNNSNSHITNCLIRNHGSTYSTGTASSVAAGSFSTITISGAVDLTTIVVGVASGRTRSYFKVTGQTAREITAVTSNTLTVYPSLSPDVSSVSYQIIQGACILIDRQGDNSVIKVENCSLQNSLAGINDQALYGCKSKGNTIENNQIGIIVGFRGNGSDVVYNSSNIDTYFESNTSYDIYWAYSSNAYSVGKTQSSFSYFIGSGATVEFYTPKISASDVTVSNTLTTNSLSVSNTFTFNGALNSSVYTVNTTSGAQTVFTPVSGGMYYLFAYDTINYATTSTAICTSTSITEISDSASVYTWGYSAGNITLNAGVRVIRIVALRVY